LFCFAGLTLLGNASMLSGWRQFALLAATFTAMLLTAKLFSKSEAKQERQPKVDGTLGAKAETSAVARTEPPSPSVSPIAGPMPASASSSAD
jgi:hypothetical protein